MAVILAEVKIRDFEEKVTWSRAMADCFIPISKLPDLVDSPDCLRSCLMPHFYNSEKSVRIGEIWLYETIW